ncbi:MAG: hypothetical protein AAF862_09090 [Pseudomonadota bacterium]
MSAVANLDAVDPNSQPEDDVASGIIGAPIPEFDTIGGTAYQHLQDKHSYILVQNRNVPFRKNMIDGYNRFKASFLSDLREAKIMLTPHGEAACYTLQRPRGGRLFIGKPIGDKILRTIVVPNILASLKSIHDESLAYRSLSAERIYYKSETQEEIMLLESFSVPAGLEHPFSYETISRAMVEPVARGEGSEADDYYALGMLIAHLMLGRDPIGGRSEQSFQQARMTQGSFAAVVSGSSITGAVSALLRGLLQDDPEQRWGYKDVRNWLNGELRTAAPGHGAWIMAQPVNFAGRTLTDRRTLSTAMQANPEAADSFIRRNATDQWVAQIAPGAEAHQAIVNLLEFGSTTKRVDASASAADAVLARFCSFLDPSGPVRFRNLTVMPDAIGPFFAACYLQDHKDKLANLQTLMSSNIWHSLMDLRALMAGPESQLDQMNSRVAWLKDAKQVNEGLERALYTLNEGLPCHSEALGDAWVSTAGQALRAIDRRCRSGSEGIKLDDSDLIAFLAARATTVRGYALKLASARPEARDSINLKMYGELHMLYGARPLPGLAKLFQARFRARIARLRGKTRRELLIQKVAEAAEQGSVHMLSKLINMDRLQAADDRGFGQAKARVKKLERAMAFAKRQISANDPTAIAKAAQVSTYFGILALLGSMVLRAL